MMEFVPTFSAFTLFASGLVGMIIPTRVAHSMEMALPTPRATAEFRIAVGGAFVLVGLWAVLVHEPVAYQAVGLVWLGAGLARMVTLMTDRYKPNPSYWGFLLLEILMGALAWVAQ